MKAAWYSQNGAAADVLHVGELPDPVPGPGQVRVRLLASGVNPSDVKSRQRRPFDTPLVVPHSDGAGVIDQVGDGVSRSRVGQRVWVWNGQWQRHMGTACQYIALPESQAVPLPDSVDMAQASCFGIPLFTAVQAVRLAGHVAGGTVLVTGAGNAVGHYVTQLAVRSGARVIGTAGSAAKAAHALAAGADVVLDYKQDDVGAQVLALTQGQGVDAIIDMDFSTNAAILSSNALKAHGVYVCYGSNTTGVLPLDFRTLMWRSNDLRAFLVYDMSPADRAACLQQIDVLLAQGGLRHTVAAQFTLSDIVQAHEMVESGQKLGTVVLSLE